MNKSRFLCLVDSNFKRSIFRKLAHFFKMYLYPKIGYKIRYTMKPGIKYTIAKEILILFGTCILALMIFLLSFLYNGYYDYRGEKEKKELQKTIHLQQTQFDSLNQSNYLIVKYWYGILTNNYHYTEDEIGSYDTFAGLIPEPERQIKLKGNLIKSDKFDKNELDRIDIFLYTFNKNIKLKDSINTEIKINNNKDIINFSKKLSFEDQKNIGFGTFLILLILVYPLRFAYLAIKWSIKTVKNKSDNN